MGTTSESSEGSIIHVGTRLSGNGDDEIPLRFEHTRLSTFEGWPANARVEPRKLARAGFYYTGQYAEARCLWCGCVITTWEYGDQVMTKHRILSPDCPFVRDVSNNVPMLNGDSGIVVDRNTTDEMSAVDDGRDSVERDSDSRRDSDIDDERQSSTIEVDVATTVGSSDWQWRDFSSSNMLVGGGNRDIGDEAFRSETVRLSTFVGWPLAFIRPADLANAGFVYVGRGDVVQCVFCRECVGDWDEEDFPHTEHRSLFPHCPFVQGCPVGNIPAENSMNPFVSTNADVTGTDVVLPTSDNNRPPSSFWSNNTDPTTSEVGIDEVGIRSSTTGQEKGPPVLQFSECSKRNRNQQIGIIRHSGPAHSKYSTLESRLRTFREWPPALKQQPQQLAEAGFFYIGLSDQVKCFYCDGGLRNWQPEDDPWTEHARWFSECGFVRLVKGDDFIKARIIEFPPDGNEMATSTTSDRSRRSPPGEQDLSTMMRTSTVVKQVLEMGVSTSLIEEALRVKMQESSGLGFELVQDLLEATLKIQNATSRDTSTTSASQGPSSTTSIQPLASANEERPAEVERSTSAPGTMQTPPSSSQVQSTSSPHPVADLLEQENRRLKDQRTCKICMDNEFGVVFLPCGHLICCVQCAPALKDCPLCRTPIQGVFKAYLS